MITLNSTKWTPELVKKLQIVLKEGRADVQQIEDAVKMKNALPNVQALAKATQK